VIGASIAVAGYEVGESRERYAANYSAGWSQFYISASTSTRHGNSTELKNIGNTQEGSHYSLKYFNGWYGFVFGMHDIKYNNYEYPANGGLGSSTLEYKEYTEGFSVGTSFRYFPLAGYKTRFSQLQIHLDLMLTYENYSSTIKDSFVSFSDETEGTGASFAIESLIPIANGFWFNMTIFKGVFVSREWELFDQTQDEMNREFNAGFSYGW
jgi:hypothetical protein